MTTVRDNLIAAKALIDTPEKWIKGAYHQGECRCAVGAISDIPDFRGRYAALKAVSECLPPPFFGLLRFNDAPATSHADVMALFDRAITAQETDRMQTREQMLRDLGAISSQPTQEG